MMTLSIIRAFHAKESGEITWDDYIHILLSRCAGIGHKQDNVKGGHPKLRKTDPFGHSIWMMSRQIGSIEDIAPLEAVFKAYRHDSLDDMKAKLNALETDPTIDFEGLKRSLALLACQERRPDVLKFCLDKGDFKVKGTLNHEAATVDEKVDPQTFKVLRESVQFKRLWEQDKKKEAPVDYSKLSEEWEGDSTVWKRDENWKWQKWVKDKKGNWKRCNCGAPPGTAAVFDVGGRFPVNW